MIIHCLFFFFFFWTREKKVPRGLSSRKVTSSAYAQIGRAVAEFGWLHLFWHQRLHGVYSLMSQSQLAASESPKIVE